MVALGILDTSVIISLGTLSPDTKLPDQSFITTITLAELAVGPGATKDPMERASRQAHLQLAETSFRALPFDVSAARTFTVVATTLRETGRKAKARSFDAQIAAIALSHSLPIFTRNPKDFQGIPGLEVHAC